MKRAKKEKNSLTDLQRKILTLLSEGKLHKEIAGRCGISVRTVQAYIVRLRAKYGASNQTKLVVLFVREKRP
jgi:DNA-binding NarL/FixJ family response regulator